jgi:hypothetical protein
MSRWTAMKAEDVERLNQQLRAAGLSPIDLSKLPGLQQKLEE